MPKQAKPGRVTRSVSLTQEDAARLDKESEDRLRSPSWLVEQALKLLFAKMDEQAEREAGEVKHASASDHS